MAYIELGPPDIMIPLYPAVLKLKASVFNGNISDCTCSSRTLLSITYKNDKKINFY